MIHDPFKKWSFLYQFQKKLTCPHCDILRTYNIKEMENEHELECFVCNKKFFYKPKFKKIYLSRTFDNAKTKFEYPNIIKREYSGLIEFLDPLDFFQGDYDHIVENDIELLYQADINVALMEKITAGTLSEIILSHLKGKEVFLICNRDILKKDPWITYWVDKIFSKPEECYDFIVSNILREINLNILESADIKGEK